MNDLFISNNIMELGKIQVIIDNSSIYNLKKTEELLKNAKKRIRNKQLSYNLVVIETFEENIKDEKILLDNNGKNIEKKSIIFIDDYKCFEINTSSKSFIDYVVDNNLLDELKSRGYLVFNKFNLSDFFEIAAESLNKTYSNFFVLPIYLEENYFGIVEFFCEEIIDDMAELEFFAEYMSLIMSTSVYNYIASLKIKKLNSELVSSYYSIIEFLVTLIEVRDSYTSGHSKNVRELSIKMGEKMKLTPYEISELSYAALLHDIGKINISRSILNKKEKLLDKEMEEIKKHSAFGAMLVSNIPKLKNLAKVILYHHERFDGSGYPTGLSGEKIPFFSRIISVADSFDAMISERAYRKAIPVDTALEIISSESSKQFDPEIVKCFIKNYNKFSKK